MERRTAICFQGITVVREMKRGYDPKGINVRKRSSLSITLPLTRIHRYRVPLQTCSRMALKLVYFDGQGRAEISRLMLAFGGIDFEDVRIAFVSPSVPLYRNYLVIALR
jgi:hypothetical protein